MATVAPDPRFQNEFLVSPRDIEAYQRDGHILLRRIAGPEEVADYRRHIADVTFGRSGDRPPMAERDTYGKAFIQVTNLWRLSPEVAKFVLARRFAGIAAQLMGVPSVRLYHDQALFKEPGGGMTPWHQDQFYWPIASDRTITMWMPMIDADEAMGTMRFASGSGAEGYLGDLPISDQSEAILSEFLASRGFPVAKAGAMAAGDATFHSGWVLHGAPGNQSDHCREVMTIIYFDAEAKIAEPKNDAQRLDLEVWFPGREPGDRADTELNPVLYP